MPSDALHLKDYRFASDDELFLDANVWLLIHGPQKPGRHARTDNYSTAFRRMLEAGSRIYIDVVVLSEIINRWASVVSHKYAYESAGPFGRRLRCSSSRGDRHCSSSRLADNQNALAAS